jgi:hypothetical protein
VLVRDRLGVIVQVAATAAPPFTAVVPRDLRIDPCEKKSKRDELRRAGQRGVDGRGRGSRKHSRSTFYSGNAAAKFAKMFNLWVGDVPRSFSCNPPRGLCEYA